MRGSTLPSLLSLILASLLLAADAANLAHGWLEASNLVVPLVLVALVVTELVVELRNAPVVRTYFRRHALSLLFAGAFVVLVIVDLAGASAALRPVYLTIIVTRNLITVLRGWSRLQRLSEFISSVVSHPARTIALSFMAVAVVGALLLMLPFTTPDGEGLAPVDALFTATSAVCVTGLIVVDTATALTTAGQAIVLGLIQIGGLGIMILSFFVVFAFKRPVSVENKIMVSYLVSETNMNTLARSVSRIVVITFCVELVGAIALYPMFRSLGAAQPAFSAAFHAVSAFCNAGFALFTTSFEQFALLPGFNAVICLLIMLGGLSFAVVINTASAAAAAVQRRGRRPGSRQPLSTTSKSVLLVSGVLLLGGMLLFYALEHGNTMAEMNAPAQYLVAFFQSVTTRTAGFNTVPIDALLPTTQLVMIVLMFIGGASGSTAGGIKVNTVAVIGAYLRGLRRGQRQTLLFQHIVPERQIATAFTVLLFGVSAVFVGTAVLTVTQPFPLSDALFEVVSAFATVGLSTGITGALSTMGKLTIVIVMLIGRVGPLTLFSAVSASPQPTRVSYPTADITIG